MGQCAPSSVTFIIYFNNNKGLVGNDIEGLAGKFCNDFFPTPTDVGVCQTQNFDIKKLMQFDQQYEALFESERRQEFSYSFKDEALWGEIRFGILTEPSASSLKELNSLLYTQTNPTKHNVDLRKIQLQIHQSNEIGWFNRNAKVNA